MIASRMRRLVISDHLSKTQNFSSEITTVGTSRKRAPLENEHLTKATAITHLDDGFRIIHCFYLSVRNHLMRRLICTFVVLYVLHK